MPSECRAESERGPSTAKRWSPPSTPHQKELKANQSTAIISSIRETPAQAAATSPYLVPSSTTRRPARYPGSAASLSHNPSSASEGGGAEGNII
eukprot:351965-Chlamydomonas_euryale.AAC.28